MDTMEKTYRVLGETVREGEYIPLCEPFGVGWWDLQDVVAGHVDEERARKAVFNQRGWPKPRQAFYSEHRWAHFLEDRTGGLLDAQFVIHGYSGLGAFPVTVVERLPF